MKKTHSRYWENMLKTLEKYFPKESKERGEALVMLAYIDMILMEDDL